MSALAWPFLFVQSELTVHCGCSLCSTDSLCVVCTGREISRLPFVSSLKANDGGQSSAESEMKKGTGLVVPKTIRGEEPSHCPS